MSPFLSRLPLTGSHPHRHEEEKDEDEESPFQSSESSNGPQMILHIILVHSLWARSRDADENKKSSVVGRMCPGAVRGADSESAILFGNKLK